MWVFVCAGFSGFLLWVVIQIASWGANSLFTWSGGTFVADSKFVLFSLPTSGVEIDLLPFVSTFLVDKTVSVSHAPPFLIFLLIVVSSFLGGSLGLSSVSSGMDSCSTGTVSLAYVATSTTFVGRVSNISATFGSSADFSGRGSSSIVFVSVASWEPAWPESGNATGFVWTY